MQIVYFARVREIIGCDGEEVELPGDVQTVADCIDWLCNRQGGYAAAFADRSKLRFAADHVMVNASGPVFGVRELAIFPPVTGG
jgi:sulfur-carrier protein